MIVKKWENRLKQQIYRIFSGIRTDGWLYLFDEREKKCDEVELTNRSIDESTYPPFDALP